MAFSGLADLIIKKKKLTVGFVEFDCSVEEVHTDAVEKTEHPIEEGSDTSDHIRKLPSTIEVNGIVTNTPLVFLASVQAPSPVTDDIFPTNDRVGTAYKELREAQANGELVDVVTSLRKYKNMVIESISVIRNAQNGNVLNCSMLLSEMQIAAQATSVSLPSPVDVGNKAAADAGRKSKDAATSAQDAKSASILASIGSFFGA